MEKKLFWRVHAWKRGQEATDAVAIVRAEDEGDACAIALRALGGEYDETTLAAKEFTFGEGEVVCLFRGGFCY